MKEAELRKHTTCALCGNKVMVSGLPLFWRVTVERFGIDMQAATRQQGLTMMLGSAGLAAVMGPDEDMAQPMMDAITLTTCEGCCTKTTCVAALAEAGPNAEQAPIVNAAIQKSDLVNR